jgi:hypothetical protein
MNTICPYCGSPDPTPGAIHAKAAPAGDAYECEGCGRISLSTGDALRKASKNELDEISRDWRRQKTPTVAPAMIGFDRRG